MTFAPGAWRYAIGPLLAAPLALVASPAASVVALALGIAVLAFFRDPERTPPPTGVVSPADGKVSVRRAEGDRVRLGVFMNVHDVHVVRAPFDATVGDVEHSPGAHRPAFSKESDRNERLRVRLDVEGTGEGSSADSRAEVTFVAGAFARRIHPYVEAGDAVDRGERIGHIAFGSRVDVRFPPAVDLADLAVDVGERVTAGESVIVASDAATVEDADS